MNIQNIHERLLNEEKRALKVYLLTFYITFILYDLFYYYLYPTYILDKPAGLESPFGFWNYVIIFGLLPVSYYLIRQGKLYIVKYLYIFIYLTVTTTSDIFQYMNTVGEFKSGNVAEIILILFSPIFINKRFFFVCLLASIIRYVMIGIVINTSAVAFPIVLIITFAAISYILLNRFLSYIHALTSANEELKHREKLAIIGQMATSIGHEIRNPLASLKGFTQLQKEKYIHDQKYFSIMEQEIERIDLIVNDLLLLGKPKSNQFQKHQMKDILSYVLSITKQQASHKQISFSLEMDPHLPEVECVENQIKQVFINVIKNGLDSMNVDGGVYTILVKQHSRNEISISFIDQGCGMSETVIENLFTPFYTTKEDGTGLGLIVSKKIIEDHLGRIFVESEVNKGTRMDVILPISQ
ncbi:signal transduction histidine kinase [Cytobacillus eiseniae]|uniref:histidine kinase n=1 Tax=Cytobacillus eiseniae TaxID=762947 RepID=A0ABS4RDP5_9BACI|nr:ATP-binding protein [Cytobacillus eiseniae]MBP2241025.1 signal transduction histidine kinase [Cytobacillus eiseniae]